MDGARAVLALGGNAIAPSGTGGTAEEQTTAIGRAMQPIADLIASGEELVLTHGNGPQVGNLLVKNDLARDVVPPMPLDWCVAQTQATIGFTICTALEHELALRGLPVPVVPIISRVRVDADDPAWQAPSKPIGRYVTDEDDVRRRMAHGETWARQGDRGWRRVVPSPEPQELLDALTMQLVLDAEAVLVANGGGGIPMVRDASGRLRGVEAVIDKDLAAVLLALRLHADALVILTDVPGVAVAYGTPEERWLRAVRVEELRSLQGDGHFASGSMGPKVEAALRFVEGGGGRAAIGPLDDVQGTLEGTVGTQVQR